MHVLYAALTWALFLSSQTLFVLLGYLVVPLMLLTSKGFESPTPFTQYLGTWRREKFLKVFWPWDNRKDSSTGDKRGWWAHHTLFGLGNEHWFSRFWWLAVRSPAHNFKRYFIGCDVRKLKIHKLAGQDYVADWIKDAGFQFLVGRGKWLNYYTFYAVVPYSFWPGKGLVIQLGHKIKLGHETQYDNAVDAHKAFTFECNPFKTVD